MLVAHSDFVLPIMNSNVPENWEVDREQARSEIISWLSVSIDTKQRRTDLEVRTANSLDNLAKFQSIEIALNHDPFLLTTLRSLTRRDVGMSQFATFLGIGESELRGFEEGKKEPSKEFVVNAAKLIEVEIDHGLIPWYGEDRIPSVEERNRAIVVSSDRILKRSTSTELRYKHEPRQLEKLKEFLLKNDYKEHSYSTLVNPLKDVPQGTFSFRANVNGMTSEGLTLKQNVDVLIKPHNASREELPIFMEAKSMTDEVNPNKRQKEEAQKVNNLKRMFGTDNQKPLVYILLIGGTVPRRYLEVEAGSGIDWVWEHRISDLLPLLQAY